MDGKQGMQLDFIHTIQEFDALAEDWNNLLTRAAVDVPFLRHEFLRAWWSGLGGGEWRNGELYTVLAREGGSDLVGAAPLFRTFTKEGLPILLFLGSFEIADYLDLLVPEREIDPFVEALTISLDAQDRTVWEVLDLYNLLEGSPSLPSLVKAAGRRGWEVQQETLHPCPQIDLGGTWEAYLAGLDKKQRHELRRKMRRAEQDPAGVHWRLHQAGEDLETAATRFLELMAHDDEKKTFLSQQMQDQFRDLMRAAQRNGWLHLSFLERDGEPVAGALSFDYGGRIWLYNSGINPEFLSLSPGWVLIGHIVQWAIEHGREALDFMRGDEKYKYRLGGVARSVQRLRISR
jgi:CelD/BcsL family acetyltransferase involved in cellulose biosynthesis